MSAGPATAHRPAVRRPPAPRGPRRVSGPARARTPVTTPRRPAPRRAPQRPVAAPRRTLGPRVAEALRGLPDARWVDRLLRGRGWILLIGVALMGLVFMQVSMLEMNAGIGQKVERAGTLERQNADLRATVSQLSSEERIQREALEMGLVMPAAGDVRFLTSRGAKADASAAVEIMRAPNTADDAALAATPVVPDEPVVPVTPAAAEAAEPTATAVTPVADPAATDPAAADPAVTPAATTEPAPTATAPEATAGAVAAPATGE